LEKDWRKSSRLSLSKKVTYQTSNERIVVRLWRKPLVVMADGFRRGRILKHMTTKAKKFLITTFSHEIFIVRVNRQTTIHGFCPRCEAEVEMLTFDAAVSLSGIGGRAVVSQLAAEEIHSLETASGHLLICRISLHNGLQKEPENEQQ
jgi:hypothetical protein